MRNLTLKQLRYFDAVVRFGHFGRAAEDCAITQPALSMQIKDLEESVGTPLLERGPRSVHLTRFGEIFAERAREILRAVDDLSDLARAAASGVAGQIRLGIIPTIAPYLLPRILSRITASYPDLDLHLRETITPNLLLELSEGRLDCAIVALPVNEPTLTEVPLFSERFLLVRPEDDAELPVPTKDMLKEMRLLLLEEGHCFRDQALSFCDLPQSKPRDMLEGSSLATLVQMVGAGIGVTLIPEMAIPVETRSARVAVSAFANPEPQRTIGIVWRRSHPLAAQLHRIAGEVREAGLELYRAIDFKPFPAGRLTS